MKQAVRRWCALALVLAMGAVLISCETQEPQNPAQGNSNTVFETGTELSIVVPSHTSWPYDANWPSWQYIREATGATLNVTAIPATDYTTKLNLLMADRTGLPDLIYLDNKQMADTYVASGALVAIDDYLDQMPNYTGFWNSLPEDERERRQRERRAADGKTYYPQNYGTDSRQGIRAWLYRKDIFEKHDLKVPETMDEVYDTAVRLKELYPDSYPLCLREGLRNIGVIGSQWKPDFTYGLYYDFGNKKWSYGAVEDTMRDMVEYMRKAHAAGLVPPDYLKINVRTWEELMSTDRGFILPDFVVRVDNFNNPNRQQNPEYTLAAMVPPRANTGAGQSLVNKFNVDPKGYVICNTGNRERIKNAVRFVDWLYSDIAADLTGWGKEGETHEVVDGKKQFIRPDEGDIEGKYGLFSYGTYLRVDPEAAVSIASDEQQAAVTLALTHTEKNYNPVYWLAFLDDMEKRRVALLDPINTYTQEQLSKFLYNQLPMSAWDGFVTGLWDMDLGELLTLYTDAYDALMEK